jgi:hypothetical protein
MIQVINQFRRIFSDNGSGDKDFTDQEMRLREAQNYLREATENLSKSAQILSDLIKSRT